MTSHSASASGASEHSLRSDAAFEALFEGQLALVHRFVTARAGSNDADDIAAEVFLVAYRKRGQFDASIGDARAWLLGIAVNVLRNHARGRRRMLGMVRRLWSEGSDDRTHEINSRLDAQAAGARLNAALDSLRADERDVFLLSAWGDLGYQEIAVALGIPVGTVRSRLSRARTKLQARLGGTPDGPPRAETTQETST